MASFRKLNNTSKMAVELKAVCKSYKRIFGQTAQVLQQVDMRVPTGVIYGLLGPSGCGKTTLLRCIIGSINPSNGTVSVFGKVPRTAGSGVPGPVIGYMPQDTALILELTIHETLLYYGRILLMEEKQLHRRIVFLANLLNLPDKNRTVKSLSGGQRRRVSLAVAIIHQPPLVILDEPTVGVDPLLRKNIWDHLFELSTEKCCTVIVTTHYNEEASRTDIVGIMRNGRLLAQTTPKELFQIYDTNCIDDAYLQLCYRDNFAKAKLSDSSAQINPTVHYRKLSDEEQDIASQSFEAREPIQRNSLINWKRVLATTKKNTVLMTRSTILFGMLLMYPLLNMTICYCVWSDRVHGLHMSIVNEDRGQLASNFLNKLDKYVIVQRNYLSVKDAYNSVHEGKAWGVIHTRANFSHHFAKRIDDGVGASDETLQFSQITINLVTTSPTVANVLKAELYKSYQRFVNEHAIRSNYSVDSLKSPILFGNPIYGEHEPTFALAASTFLLICLTYMTYANLASISLVMERKLGSFERSWAAGVTTAEVIISRLIVLFILVLLQAIVTYYFVKLVYHLEVKGSIALVVTLTILQGICGMAHGFLLSVIFTDVSALIAGILSSVFLLCILGGFLWPIEGMPIWLRYISYCTPLTIPHDAMKSIYTRGWGLNSSLVYMGFVVSCTWIIIIILLSFLILRIQNRQ